MKYMGSKNRIAKYIIPLFNHNSIYIEPFVGGANIIDKVSSTYKIAADIDEDLICLYQAISEGWLPPKEFTEQQYNEIKHSETSPLKGYAAFALSYGGKKWGGWRRDSKGVRNYVDEAYRNALKQFPKLLGIKFILSSVFDLELPKEKATIYCDPPYRDTTMYKHRFDHDLFWEWVRTVSQKHDVYVSEYNAPLDFKCVWQKSLTSSLTKNTGSKMGIEKLFVFGECK